LTLVLAKGVFASVGCLSWFCFILQVFLLGLLKLHGQGTRVFASCFFFVVVLGQLGQTKQQRRRDIPAQVPDKRVVFFFKFSLWKMSPGVVLSNWNKKEVTDMCAVVEEKRR
jgi:hypothetical protein